MIPGQPAGNHGYRRGGAFSAGDHALASRISLLPKRLPGCQWRRRSQDATDARIQCSRCLGAGGHAAGAVTGAFAAQFDSLGRDRAAPDPVLANSPVPQ